MNIGLFVFKEKKKSTVPLEYPWCLYQMNTQKKVRMYGAISVI